MYFQTVMVGTQNSGCLLYTSKEIQEKEAQLESAQEQIDAAKAKLNSSQAQLEEKEAELASGEAHWIMLPEVQCSRSTDVIKK